MIWCFLKIYIIIIYLTNFCEYKFSIKFSTTISLLSNNLCKFFNFRFTSPIKSENFSTISFPYVNFVYSYSPKF